MKRSVLSSVGYSVLLAAGLALAARGGALAIEGPAAAGPIGGTDIRSAVIPPPGLYGGAIFFAAETFEFVDGHGETIPALRDAKLKKQVAAPFLYFVPDAKAFGGSLALGAVLPFGHQCGHLFIREETDCTTSVGDLYAEVQWSRSFGKLRPSKYSGAYPIFEGLTTLLGFGMVFPVGAYDFSTPTKQALSIGTNIWDFAPLVAVTYTTAPLIAEGTEISAKFYWNNYLENPDTDYLTGDLLNLDFAITEKIGRFQVGLAGFYVVQIEDDKLDGVPIAPDGLRGEILQLGGIVAYDMPSSGSGLKFKALTSAFAENTPTYWSAVLTWGKKF